MHIKRCRLLDIMQNAKQYKTNKRFQIDFLLQCVSEMIFIKSWIVFDKSLIAAIIEFIMFLKKILVQIHTNQKKKNNLFALHRSINL